MKGGEVARSVSRGAFYLSLEKVAALLSGLLYFALLLRWLGPSKYGIMTLALSFVGIATVATGNLEVFLERFAAEYQARGALRTLLRAQRLALAFKVAAGAAASAILVLIAPMLARRFDAPDLAVLVPLLTLIVVFDGLSTTGRATLFGMQRFRAIFLIALMFHIGKTVMVGLLWASGSGLFELATWLALITVAQGALMTAAPLWILRHARDAEGNDPEQGTTRNLVRSMWSYTLPLLGARGTWLAGQNVGKIVLGKLFEAYVLGYFSFAFQVIERFVELFHTLPTALLPSLTHLVARNERSRMLKVFNQASRLIQVIACGVSFLLFAFAREITLFVASPLFEPAVPLLRVMALVPMFRTAQQPLTMVFQALRLPGAVFRLAILKFVAEFGSYFVLIPWLGVLGAGWANVFGAAFSFVAALLLLSRHVPEGSMERLRAAVKSIALVMPFIGFTLLAHRWLGGTADLVVRVLLVPIAVVAVFATRLIIAEDLVKLASIPLRFVGVEKFRDSFVRQAERLTRVFASRGTP